MSNYLHVTRRQEVMHLKKECLGLSVRWLVRTFVFESEHLSRGARMTKTVLVFTKDHLYALKDLSSITISIV